jgi:glucokinase
LKCRTGGCGIELIGVNVGGTTSTVVRGDSSGSIEQILSFATLATRGPQALYADITSRIRALLTPETRALGLAIGGPLDRRRGIIDAVHLPFNDFPLIERLRGEFSLPLGLHHDAAACALAEWLWGESAGSASLAYLTCGTGFGVGLILEGRVRYGSNGHSPEIGHVRYAPTGPDVFGKPGCFEGFGSAAALSLLARERYPDALGGLAPAQIAQKAREGDASARDIVDENVSAVGAACALLADLLVLDVIVLGSLSRYLGESWIAAVRQVFEHEALPSNARHCRVAPAMNGVQDLSGLAAALDATNLQ